jgi:hypothetical protein
MIVLVVLMFSLLTLWVSQGPRRWAVAVVGTLAVWLALAAVLARMGVLSQWTARPPRLPLVAGGGLLLAFLLFRTATFRTLLDSTPAFWPIGLQVFRVGVEVILFDLHASGRAPVQVTFAGRNLDILMGLTAPLVAWWVVRRRASPWLVLGWNVLGLGVLANTVAVVVTSTPGPLHLWPGPPFTEILRWPLVWLPAFLAPLAVLLHVASLRQTVPLLRSTPGTARSG